MSSSLDLLGSFATNDSENLITQSSSQEESELELTAFEVIQRLEKAWMNEHFAPELLEPQIEVVECLFEQIKTTEENLEQLDRGHFAIPIHKMELARVRFMIASYLRLRLQKIQHYVHFLSKRSDDEINSKLTTEEATYLRSYKANIDGLFKKLALDHMPGKASDFSRFGEVSSSQGDPPKPNLNAAVFVKALENIQGVFIEDEAGRGRDEEYDMEKGSQHILRYKSISHLVQSGALKLIWITSHSVDRFLRMYFNCFFFLGRSTQAKCLKQIWTLCVTF